MAVASNPLLMPHITIVRDGKLCQPPHVVGTQEAAKRETNPHQSPTYPEVEEGVGVHFDWCIIKESTYMYMSV